MTLVGCCSTALGSLLPSPLFRAETRHTTHIQRRITAAQAFRIWFNPVSQMMMQPSQGDLTTWLEIKVNPMVDAKERLQHVLARPRGGDGVNNQRIKGQVISVHPLPGSTYAVCVRGGADWADQSRHCAAGVARSYAPLIAAGVLCWHGRAGRLSWTVPPVTVRHGWRQAYPWL